MNSQSNTSQEIEVKYLDVDTEEIRRKLARIGADLIYPTREFKRVLLDYPDKRFQKNNHSRRLRIRDEGEKIFVNFKQENGTNYVDETELEVESFETARSLLKAIGLVEYSYQESRRELWIIDDVEVVIDEWPWLNPYIEIEGKSEDAIKSIAIKLGLDWNDACFGSVDTAYKKQYKKMKEDESVGDVPEVRFDMPVPRFFHERL